MVYFVLLLLLYLLLYFLRILLILLVLHVAKPTKISTTHFLDCIILGNYVFGNFILADKPFVNVLRSLEACVLLNNYLCRKLFSSLKSPITIDERFKVISALYFIPDISLLSCELENSIFRVLF